MPAAGPPKGGWVRPAMGIGPAGVTFNCTDELPARNTRDCRQLKLQGDTQFEFMFMDSMASATAPPQAGMLRRCRGWRRWPAKRPADRSPKNRANPAR